jgi:hypothetical protein
MGKGGAQLGKAVKGKSRERKAAKKARTGLGGGESSMTDRENKAEEHEKRNQINEVQRQRLKKLYLQEETNTKANKTLLLNEHRKFMRVDKTESLGKETETLAQNHERDVDRKDAILQMLTRDLDDCDEQFQTSQRTHMEQLGQLNRLHKEKVYRVESEFERDLKMIKEEFSKERKMIKRKHEQEKKVLLGVIAAVEQGDADCIAEAKQTHETGREEIRNKNLESINELRINLENKIEDLEKQFDEAHQNYVDGTGQANKDFKSLQAEDKKRSSIIAVQKRKIERYQTSLAYWKKKIENNKKECMSRNKALFDQKKMILGHCNTLKQRMARFRTTEGKKLTELSVLSREALHSNEKLVKKAERIVQLAELARKYETEREKVLPFYESTPMPDQHEAKHDDDDAAAREQRMQEELQRLQLATALTADGKPVDEWSHLDTFFKKYNKVLVDKLAIEQEKLRLKKENADLRNILKQYLDGIAITDDVVDNDNPLLIVNGRINLLEREKQVKRLGKPNNITNLGATRAVARNQPRAVAM